MKQQHENIFQNNKDFEIQYCDLYGINEQGNMIIFHKDTYWVIPSDSENKICITGSPKIGKPTLLDYILFM